MPNHIRLAIMLIAILACYPLAKATTSAQAGTVRPTPAPPALPAGLTRVKVGNEWDVKREEVIAVADWLYFRQGAALWKSDGTPAGTQLLVDFAPTPWNYGAIHQITNVNGNLFFFVYDQDGDDDGLWVYQPEVATAWYQQYLPAISHIRERLRR